MAAGGFTLCGRAPFETTIEVVLARPAAIGLVFENVVLALRCGLGPADCTLDDLECEATRGCLGELILDLLAIFVVPEANSDGLISVPPLETSLV